jgi:hypothetical protein
MKLILFFTTLVFIFLFGGCKDKLSQSNQFKSTPLVYAVLDASEEYHYVKVNRAYIGPGDSYQIAKVTDSLYYNNTVCVIKELKGTIVLRSWILRDTILQNKEQGAFASPEVRVKYFKTIGGAYVDVNTVDLSKKLKNDPLITYKFELNVENGKYNVSGSTKLVSGVSILSPSATTTVTFFNTSNGFQNPNITYNYGTGVLHDLRYRITIREYKSSGDSITKTFDMKVGENPIASGSVGAMNANGKTFYETIKNNITNDPSITKRLLLTYNVVLTGGSQDLQNFILISKPTTSLSQNKPVFTNLTCVAADGSDARVVGIFTSRHTVTQIRKPWYSNNFGTLSQSVSFESMKELCVGSITKSTDLFK